MAIDKVSQALGRMESTLESHADVHDQILLKLDRLDDKMSSLGGSINAAHTRIDYVEDETKVAKEQSQDWMETKKKARWMIGGGAFAGTLSGVSIGKFLSSLVGLDSQ